MPSIKPSEISCTGQPIRSSIMILSKKASTAAATLHKPHRGYPAQATQIGPRLGPLSSRSRTTRGKHSACTYQFPTTTLIVGRDPIFGCGASSRQLHEGSAKALLGSQQRTAYVRSTAFVLRSGGGCSASVAVPTLLVGTLGGGKMCCVPTTSTLLVDWLGCTNNGGTPTFWLV